MVLGKDTFVVQVLIPVSVVPVGNALPPRRLQIHDLSTQELLGHAAPIQAVLPHKGMGTAATLDTDGRLLLWQLQPLRPQTVLQAPG